MKREQFVLDVTNVDWVEAGGEPKQPCVEIDFTGPKETFLSRITKSNGELLAAKETDVAFRLVDHRQDPDAAGVVSVTNRLTGDFILELNVDAASVFQFIKAAREFGKRANGREGRYRAQLRTGGDSVVDYEKGTFLVYDAAGDLLRKDSLIPSGVEL
ncbi:DUF5793 family protein [Haloferacaceae archaeon DSL9]